jgi:hypothetical protein
MSCDWIHSTSNDAQLENCTGIYLNDFSSGCLRVCLVNRFADAHIEDLQGEIPALSRSKSEQLRAVCIEPYQEMVDLRVKELQGGQEIVNLTGDTSADL